MEFTTLGALVGLIIAIILIIKKVIYFLCSIKKLLKGVSQMSKLFFSFITVNMMSMLMCMMMMHNFSYLKIKQRIKKRYLLIHSYNKII